MKRMSEEESIAFFYQYKWPNGFRCPKCGHGNCYTIQTRRLPLYECVSCKHQTSLTAGTVMERSRTPLWKWAVAMQMMASPAGMNAVQLSGAIGVSHKTAWNMMRKIRHVISIDEDRRTLAGKVRIGPAHYGRMFLQTYVPHPQVHPVLIGLSTGSDGRYVKIQTVDRRHTEGRFIDRTGTDEFIRRNVHSAGIATVLNRVQYSRDYVLRDLFDSAKRWINRTFHGIGIKTLQTYLNEYCFRWNRLSNGATAHEALLRLCMYMDTESVRHLVRKAA